MNLKKRTFLLAAAASTALAWAAPARAQPKKPAVLIAWLNSHSLEAGGAHWLASFKEGLAALGWKEGDQYIIEERWANGHRARLQPLAEELATRRPAIFVAAVSPAVAAASKAAPTTAVVHANGADPVLLGFAKSLAKPGGMITGVTSANTDVTSKYLEILLAAAPKVKHVGFLLDPGTTMNAVAVKGARESAGRHGIHATFANVARPEEIEGAITRLAAEGAQALVLMPSPILGNERRRVMKLALAHRWPTIGNVREWADAGALVSYGPDVSAAYRRAAYFVDKILKGAKPGDIPFEQPTQFQLIVNSKTAKALGVTISQELLLRADKVIE